VKNSQVHPPNIPCVLQYIRIIISKEIREIMKNQRIGKKAKHNKVKQRWEYAMHNYAAKKGGTIYFIKHDIILFSFEGDVKGQPYPTLPFFG
jgi:hypothetical protein